MYTTMCTFAVLETIEYIKTKKSDVNVLLLDASKAFDRVNHKFLLKVMETFGIGDNFIGWVRKIYPNARKKYLYKVA